MAEACEYISYMKVWMKEIMKVKVKDRKLHRVSLSCSEDLKLVHLNYCTQYKVRMTPQNFVKTIHCNCKYFLSLHL